MKGFHVLIHDVLRVVKLCISPFNFFTLHMGFNKNCYIVVSLATLNNIWYDQVYIISNIMILGIMGIKVST